MIESHTQKFVFVKIPKTAGESIVSVLEQYAFPNAWNAARGNHETYREIIEHNSAFKNYFSFAFVRNPWELKLSRYFYIKSVERESPILSSFSKWVKSGSPYEVIMRTGKFKGQYREIEDWFPSSQLKYINELMDDNSAATSIDFIGRFENLQEDFNTICDKIGIPQQELPHKNKTKHKHYTEYYDDETRQIVAEKYAKDIEYFGYEFGE